MFVQLSVTEDIGKKKVCELISFLMSIVYHAHESYSFTFSLMIFLKKKNMSWFYCKRNSHLRLLAWRVTASGEVIIKKMGECVQDAG